MKTYVIYSMSTGQIVKLQNEEPDFSKMSDDDDFDLTANWMTVNEGKSKLESFLSK